MVTTERAAQDAFEQSMAAVNNGELDTAIELLLTVLNHDARHAGALYLLSSLYAARGKISAARDTLARALKVNPKLPATAHFQLGLYYLLDDDMDAAQNAWQTLLALPEDHALSLFARGLRALGERRYDESLNQLRRGLKLNTYNAALNDDVRKIIARVETLRLEAAKRSARVPADPPAKNGFFSRLVLWLKPNPS